MRKLIRPRTWVAQVRVDGDAGVYIYGAARRVMFLDRTGAMRFDRVRIAGNVLVWSRGPLTIRIEGTLTLERAVGLARSLR